MNSESYVKKARSNKTNNALLLFFSLICFIGAYFVGDDLGFKGLLTIVTSPALLIQDALILGGISGALLNTGIIALINIAIFMILDINHNGMLLAAFFTIFGFSFMGMNIYNVLPIYLGGYLYSVYTKKSFKNVVLISIFASCLAPIVSHSFFGFNLDFSFALILSITKGALLGFFIIPLASSMLRFHEGFNLYNVGFTSGIIAIVYASLYRSFFGPIDFSINLYQETSMVIIIMILSSSLYLLILGLLSEDDLWNKWQEINKSSGRLVSDFTNSASLGSAYFNMGILGIFSFLVVLVLNGNYNGPVMAGIFTVLGFGAFGKHLFNSVPVMVGGVIGAILLGLQLSSTAAVVSILFVSTIAPIAGVYGIGWGIIAGFLHVAIVGQFGGFHAGMNLYNNGFTGGIVAAILVPMINVLRRKTNE